METFLSRPGPSSVYRDFSIETRSPEGHDILASTAGVPETCDLTAYSSRETSPTAPTLSSRDGVCEGSPVQVGFGVIFYQRITTVLKNPP